MSSQNARPDGDQAGVLSRRDVLKQATAAGVAVAAPACAVTNPRPATPTPPDFTVLNRTESQALQAIVARLIPSDAHGAGALEAGAAVYIDRALGGAYAALRDAYGAGLAAVDAHAQASSGAPFAALTEADQDAVLTAMEENRASGFSPDSATFFNLVRGHTIEGTFSDPVYGGNRDYVGWEMLRYPGLSLAVQPAQQQLARSDTTRHRSAYDFPQFAPPKGTRGR